MSREDTHRVGSKRSKSLVHVLGAGVLGCTCALKLAESGRYDVIVTARDLPTDVDSQGFASPWAGAHWRSSAAHDGIRMQRWETATFEKFMELLPHHPDIFRRVHEVQYSDKPLGDPWFAKVLPNYRRLRSEELSEFVDGYTYDSLSLLPHKYLAWLQSESEKLGVTFRKKHLQSLDEAFTTKGDKGRVADVVVNCTGLGAKGLVGVQDEAVQPIKGQTILVRGPPGFSKITTVGDYYVIPRADDTVILGGCKLVDDWSLSFDKDLADRILGKCHLLAPELGASVEDLQVIGHNVGLRPGRRGGPRLEAEEVHFGLGGAGGKSTVVHAYGIGGSGYQASWGMAEDVLRLVDQNPGAQKPEKNIGLYPAV